LDDRCASLVNITAVNGGLVGSADRPIFSDAPWAETIYALQIIGLIPKIVVDNRVHTHSLARSTVVLGIGDTIAC
jgi:hypothetical protein